MAICITADSTCDLNHLAVQRDIKIIPLKVNLDMDTFLDGVDITPQQIFDFVKETKMLPRTSAASVTDYEEFFEEHLKGADELIHFSISQKSSVSHTVACQAAEKFAGKVHVIDSMALSTGQGLLVLKAADMRDAGATADEIVETINDLRPFVNTSFIPDRLDYLFKGGRCSRMQMYGANLLGIHPLIDMVDGALTSAGKYKGKMPMIIKKYVADLAAKYPKYDKTRCFITHSSADEEIVQAAKEAVAANFDFEVVEETIAGSIITSHCGKNTLGVLFIHE